MVNQTFAADTSALAGLALAPLIMHVGDAFEAVLLHAEQIVLVEPRKAATNAAKTIGSVHNIASDLSAGSGCSYASDSDLRACGDVCSARRLRASFCRNKK